MSTNSVFVDRHYLMDPNTEDLLAEGTDLKDGMIVLLEDSLMRVSVSEDMRPYDQQRALENNRFCKVTHLKVRQRYEYNDMGVVIGEGSPLISFVAVYGDGVKMKRTYDSSYAWIVKLNDDGEIFISE